MLRAPCPCGVPELAAMAAGGGEGDLGSVPRGPRRVHIKGKAPHRSKGPREPAKEGLTPAFLWAALTIVRTGGSPIRPRTTFKGRSDPFPLRMLLFGTEQINGISVEFPLLHQSPLSADVGEKRHGWWPCYLSEPCLTRQGVQEEPSQAALCLPRVVGGGVFPLPVVSMLSGRGWSCVPPRSVPGGTWVGTLKG